MASSRIGGGKQNKCPLAKSRVFRRNFIVMLRQSIVLILLAAVLVLKADFCKAQSRTTNSGDSAFNTNQQTFEVKGIVKELPADGRTVVIKHEAVTNYMPAMTMPFEVHDTNELRGLLPGDAVTFRMVVASADAWIDHITNLGVSRSTKASPAHLSFRQVRDVDLLQIGDALPEYHFTNELGHALSTKQFLGQPFAFTFFFTRCPYPTFCPLLSINFAATQKILLATNAPANWHLISISFDTEHDSPSELKAYAERYDYQPTHWSFVTGDLTEITALGDQVGEYFGRDENGGVTHNLRTVVVDARGRIQKIFTNNRWTPEDLAAELVKAAAVKP
jgi:protein SCO1